MATRLQNLLFPHPLFAAPEEMYVRCCDGKVSAMPIGDGKLLFKDGGVASFDTFFNAISIGVWKRHTAISDLFLVLEGEGSFLLRFGIHDSQGSRILQECRLHLSSDLPCEPLLIEGWSGLSGGMLFFSLEAQSPGSVTAGHFTTSSPPRRQVKLGIVITHFLRETAVLEAAARIRKELLSDPDHAGCVELIVVDNSRSLPSPPPDSPFTILPNRNLGGSGGFTRGLLHLEDHGGFTHCLFMDDDASCEIESIKRARHLLGHARDPSLAVSGALLREVEPFRLFEKGARFDVFVHPLKSGLDMRRMEHLLLAEEEDPAANYGAWWFFAFPIQHVRKYPFPFFVRGDDILFGIDNKFPLATMNGIACWGEDFEMKCGPMTAYLDTRNHVLQALFSDSLNRFQIAKMVFSLMCAHLFSYNYASATSCLLAWRHVMEGPRFFVENIDLSSVRAEIQRAGAAEKLAPAARPDDLVVLDSDLGENPLRTAWRWATLNGFLLPGFFLRNRTVLQPKGFRGTFRKIFRFRSVYYEYAPAGLGYTVRHDKHLFFTTLADFFALLPSFLGRFRQIHSDFRQSLDAMTSKEFWRGIFI
jgi:galactofuranosylgalactofuranosylrhamnosyl-N-acetylglucosaminyl-diphospho-decaprenol beta-1,5/1,6-galactofuranosyltransferase